MPGLQAFARMPAHRMSLARQLPIEALTVHRPTIYSSARCSLVSRSIRWLWCGSFLLGWLGGVWLYNSMHADEPILNRWTYDPQLHPLVVALCEILLCLLVVVAQQEPSEPRQALARKAENDYKGP